METRVAINFTYIIDELMKVQTNFTWKNTTAKIKNKTLILDHKQGRSKCADVTLETMFVVKTTV